MLVMQAATLFGVAVTLGLTYQVYGILCKGQISTADSGKTSEEKKDN